MRTVRVSTGRREELVDVTALVREIVRSSGVAEGTCLVASPHTTVAVTVNEGWDPDVGTDAVSLLGRLVPRDHGFRHAEGNSDAHIKAMLVGSGVTLPVSGGEVQLGRWQAIFLCEFDGPRDRELWVSLSGGG